MNVLLLKFFHFFQPVQLRLPRIIPRQYLYGKVCNKLNEGQALCSMVKKTDEYT